MATQQPQTTQVHEPRPAAAFSLSLVAGLLILAGSAAVMTTPFPANGPYYYNGMMGGYYGGMMGGYYGVMRGVGFGASLFYGLGGIGVVSGVVILIGAIMLYNRPAQASTWGALVLGFSVLSFFGMGGFFVGAVLGVVGGMLALTWNK